jgi:hypothetical protein
VKRFAALVSVSGLIALLTLGLSGCGGSSTQPVGVSVASSRSAIDQAQTVSITASVSNDTKASGVQWTVSGGGTLSGQTTASATYNAPVSVPATFTATVTATSISDATKSGTVQIKVNPLPVITTTTLPAATAGVPYSATVGESGGTAPYVWTITSGTLPAGFTLNSSTGVIAGTATGASSSAVTLQVADAVGNSSSQPLVLTVNPPPPLTVTTGSLPGAALSVAYSQTLQAAGGVPPYKWTLTAGSLPAGLNLSTAGVISGTPTGTIGTSSFTVTVTDSQTPTSATNTANLSITVALAPLSVATTSLAGAVINSAYSQTLLANGGTPPYTWSISAGALPPGLILNPATGVIAGTPTTTGTSTFTAKVTDSAASTATAILSIIVNTVLAITPTPLPGGSVGAAYSATVQATGGLQPYAWSITTGSLPPGLAINATTGTISGTPTATGTSAFTVTLTDAENPPATTSANLSISIAAQNCTDDASLTGNYAFESLGWSSSTAAISVAGSFLADGNGNITAGLLDLAEQGISSGPLSGTFTGTYCVTSSNLATITLTYTGGLSGGNTFVAALDLADSNGHIISYDSSDRKVSGLLRQQDTSAFLTSKIDGNYAFGIVGNDQIGYRFGMAGEFASDGNGSLSGEYDSDDAGLLQASQTISSTNFSVASNGRGTATLTSTLGNTKFVFYVVSASEMLMMAVDTETSPAVIAGQVLQQSGTLTDASLNGVSVLELASLGSTGSQPAALAGLVNTTGTSATYNLNADQNQAGTMSEPTDSGTFSVSSNGRVTLSSTAGGAERIFYLVAQNQAFVIGTNPGVEFGVIEPQTGTNFTAAALSGIYLGGSQPPQSASVNEEADYLNSNGAGALSETSDKNGTGGVTQSGPTSATYLVSGNGRVVVSQNATAILILYMISGSQAVALPVSSTENPNADPALIDFHK